MRRSAGSYGIAALLLTLTTLGGCTSTQASDVQDRDDAAVVTESHFYDETGPTLSSAAELVASLDRFPLTRHPDAATACEAVGLRSGAMPTSLCGGGLVGAYSESGESPSAVFVYDNAVFVEVQIDRSPDASPMPDGALQDMLSEGQRIVTIGTSEGIAWDATPGGRAVEHTDGSLGYASNSSVVMWTDGGVTVLVGHRTMSSEELLRGAADINAAG